MLIDKLIVEESATFLPGRVPDISIRIETEDPNWIKPKIKQLNLLNGNFFYGNFQLLKEIENFFSDEIRAGNKIEINEVKMNFNDSGKKIKQLYDTLETVRISEENEFRTNLSNKISIQLLKISVPWAIEGISFRHIGYIVDKIHINMFTQDCSNISIQGCKEIKIDGMGRNITEISLIELPENSIVELSNIRKTALRIINQSLPFSKKTIGLLEIHQSDIEFLEFFGFQEFGFKVLKASFIFSFFRKGFVKNIDFQEIHISNVEFHNTSFYDVLFPENRDLFLVQDTLFKGSSFSNVNWGEYFAEKEIVRYVDGGTSKIKEYPISPGGLKEIYRMLKYEHDQIGNKTEANKFFAKEMEYHMKSLEESGNMKDYWVAWIQKFVSNFGQDWARALTIYFIVCLLGFCFAQLGQGLLNFLSGSDYLVPSVYIAWKELVQYLNPLPKIDEVPGFWYLVVSIIKLLMVYQITVALRRISQR